MEITSFFPPTLSGVDFGQILANSLNNVEGELFLICAEYTKSEQKKSDFAGLDLGLRIDRKEKPMIICSFMSEDFFLKEEILSSKFSALVAQKGVGFMRLPFSSTELHEKYVELVEDEKQEDLLAIEINNLVNFNNIISNIRHKIHYRLDNGSESDKKIIAEAIVEARERLGLSGTDEGIIKQIVNFSSEEQSPFIGKHFPGVFCDIENTLLINGEVNQGLLKKLRGLSETMPITLWTGAVLEIDSLKKKLIQEHITWKLVSKTLFSGAEVDIAFDDESYEDFFKKYNVKVKDFIKV